MSKLILFSGSHEPSAALTRRFSANLGYDCISLEEALNKEGDFRVPDCLGFIAPLGKVTPDEKVIGFIKKFLRGADNLADLGYLWFVNPVEKGQSFKVAQAVTESVVAASGMRTSYAGVLAYGEDSSEIESEIKSEAIKPPKYSFRAGFIARRYR